MDGDGGDIRRVVIVEDEAIIALDMEATLEDAGHVVVGIADSRASALELVDDRPDLALVDVNLRDGPSGTELARALTARGVQCVLVTGNCPADATTEIAIGCLAKPVNAAALRATVDAATMVREGRKPASLPYGLSLF